VILGVCQVLSEYQGDLSAFDERAAEPTITYEDLLKTLKPMARYVELSGDAAESISS